MDSLQQFHRLNFIVGGTVGALQTCISAVPMTLATSTANITSNAPMPAPLPSTFRSRVRSQDLGFNKSGGGVLILSGANNYAGTDCQ